MTVLHDFKCKVCERITEKAVDSSTWCIVCPVCKSSAVKTFEQFKFRKQLEFPEGPWHCLEEVDGHAPDIRTRRQLREHLKRTTRDRHTQKYSKYDDGIAGY